MSVSTTTMTTIGEGVPALRSTSFSCPACRAEMRNLDDSCSGPVYCPRCTFVIREREGIFRALLPGRELHFRQFVEQYATVRMREGRGSSSPAFYTALPFRDLTGNNTWEWKIRCRTFLYAMQRIFSPIETAYPRGCDVLDIGAGNCWLSYQLAKRGHRPVAVDLLDNETDGLGAARKYSPYLRHRFLCVQAEMDHLPFAAAQFDIVFFNAAFHYSADYGQTLGEALRCLRRPGHLIISDSPFYRSDLSGQKMISDSIPSCEYLTRPILDHLADRFGLRWKTLKPWYGINWALRPLKAYVLRKREPSNFYLFWAQVDQSAIREIRGHAELSSAGGKTA